MMIFKLSLTKWLVMFLRFQLTNGKKYKLYEILYTQIYKSTVKWCDIKNVGKNRLQKRNILYLYNKE